MNVNEKGAKSRYMNRQDIVSFVIIFSGRRVLNYTARACSTTGSYCHAVL